MAVKNIFCLLLITFLLSGCSELNRFTLSGEEQKLVGTWIHNYTSGVGGCGLRFESNRKIYLISFTEGMYVENDANCEWRIEAEKLIYSFDIGQKMELMYKYSLSENILCIVNEYGETCYVKVK